MLLILRRENCEFHALNYICLLKDSVWWFSLNVLCSSLPIHPESGCFRTFDVCLPDSWDSKTGFEQGLDSSSVLA